MESVRRLERGDDGQIAMMIALHHRLRWVVDITIDEVSLSSVDAHGYRVEHRRNGHGTDCGARDRYAGQIPIPEMIAILGGEYRGARGVEFRGQDEELRAQVLEAIVIGHERSKPLF